MLATLMDKPFSSDEWLYERKLDGERCLAFRHGRKVDLRSRNRKTLNGSYPEIVDALERQNLRTFIVDGEIVAFEGNRTSFSRLQQRMQIRNGPEAPKSDVAVHYYVFDFLHCGAYDLTRLDLQDRKGVLKRVFVYERKLRFTPHRIGKGEEYFREACDKGWEGLIAKRADSPYAHSRSRQWLKFKCTRGQEFVVGGFTDPQGRRPGFGALLVGYYAEDELRYAGKVGTGYDEETLHRLRDLADRAG